MPTKIVWESIPIRDFTMTPELWKWILWVELRELRETLCSDDPALD